MHDADKARIAALGSGRFELHGHIDLQSVNGILAAGMRAFAAFDSLRIDLAAADCASTAGLALLVEWATWAANSGRRLVYEQFGPAERAIADINGVSELLTVESYRH